MTTANDIKQAITHFRKLYYDAIRNNSFYPDMNEYEILESLHNLDDLYKRMTESNRSDFIGGEI